jgi:UMF1 family MFS transporter
MFGYAGSLILAFNLTMVMMPEWYGISDGSLPARISFLSVGIWWMGFAQLHFIIYQYVFTNQKDYIFKGLRELRAVLDSLKDMKNLKQFLTAFYSIGVQTVILWQDFWKRKN